MAEQAVGRFRWKTTSLYQATADRIGLGIVVCQSDGTTIPSILFEGTRDQLAEFIDRWRNCPTEGISIQVSGVDFSGRGLEFHIPITQNMAQGFAPELTMQAQNKSLPVEAVAFETAVRFFDPPERYAGDRHTIN